MSSTFLISTPSIFANTYIFFFFVVSSLGRSRDDQRAGELYQAHLGDSF